MAFNHRKLYSELCPLEFCDPTKNNSGVCPRTCFLICPSICYLPFSSITLPPTPATFSYDETHKPHKLSPLLIIILTLLATTLLIICCYAFYRKYYSRWNSSRRRSQPQPQPQPDDTHDEFHDEDPGPEVEHHIWYINTIGLQPSIISKITVCKYKRGDGLVEGTECSVCLNEFQDDETLRLLPKCNHAFHIPCIDTWLRSHTNCPMCRAGIVANVVGTSSPEPINDILGQGEETHMVISENNREFGREREDGVCELGVGTEEEGELGVENGRKTNENSKEELGNDNHLEVDEVQPMRRSVSMDSLSASMISLALANVLPVQSDGNSNTQLVKVTQSNMGIVSKRVGGNQSLLKLMASSSIGRSLQNGAPISMKRSFSCSAKFLLSRSSRSRNSVLPL